MARIPIIAGNWKMYKTQEEVREFIRELTPQLKQSKPEVYLAVPFTLIRKAYKGARDTKIVIGAQNMHDELEGAFTGEISAPMLKDVHAHFVVLGHSERRNIFKEDDAFINRKVKRALSTDLQVILCIGELQNERDEGRTEEVLQKQLDESLKEIAVDRLKHIVIAYEPVWAIGTGKTATPEIAEKAHAFCRAYVAERWGVEAAEAMRILYGGSVKPDNVSSLMAQPNIDGALVGGASLKVDSFAKLINSM